MDELDKFLGESPKDELDSFLDDGKEDISGGEYVSGLAGKALQGMTFGFSDELAGAVAGDNVKAQERQRMAQMSEQHPASSLGAELGGAVLGAALTRGMLPYGKTITAGLANYASRGLPQALTTATGVGGLSGGLYGAGTSEGTLQERLPDAAQGAGFGVLGGGLGVGISRAVPSIAKRMSAILGRKKQVPIVQKSVAELAESADVIPSIDEGVQQTAVGKIKEAVAQDFPEDAALETWKDTGGAALVELGGAKSRQLAKGSAQYAGGQKVAEKFFRERIAKAPEKLKQSIATNIAGGDAYYAQVDDILDAGRSKAAPLYKKAYQGSVNVELKPEVTKALSKARADYASELANVPDNSIKALDYAKKVLDDDIGEAMRAGKNNLARSRTQIKNELLSAMDEASPDYAQARKSSGDYLSLTSAMESGKDFMKLDPEMVQKTIKGMGEPEKLAFRSGVSKQLRDLIDKTPEGQNMYNRVFGRPEQQKRLASILTPSQYTNLAQDMKAQDRLFKLRNEVLGGSPTTSKAVAAAEVAAISADIATQTPTATSAIAGGLKRMFDGLNDKRAQDVAKILFEERPAQKLKLYQEMVSQKSLSKAEKQLASKAYFTVDKLMKESNLAGALGGGVGGASVAPERYVPKADSPKDDIGDLIKNTPESKPESNTFVDKIIGAESGGNPNAKNPKSSATGLGQFISSTWMDMINRHAPELAEGKSRDAVLALRKNPEISRRMTELYVGENSSRLERAGIKPTDGNLYLAHFLGAGGALKVLKAKKDKPVELLVSRDAVKANKSILKGKTAGEVIRWAQGKMS
tara:strand:- start:5298 stop:7727 length:2430 start_codon:yes stop_codon:yes gene_type:complete